MISLEDYGWNDFHQHNYSKSGNFKERTGRVTSVQGFKYHLITGNGEVEAELAGRLLYGSEGDQLPKVGDWVCYLDYGVSGYIIECLPRQNILSRKAAGKRNERQVLGTNIDFACVVQGLDRDFNIKRLDRYITQIVACGITPIVILNKSDLVEDTAPFVQAVNELNRNCAVFTCSNVTKLGIDEIRNHFIKARTYLMLGSSGVGKSSLLNVLMNNEVQVTSEVSDFNSKGRHTTTARELFMLPNGSLLMDTPGMREFGVTSEDGGDDTFPAIEEFATNCRFTDCTHMMEDGCGVIAALNSGELDAAVYDSYVKLVKEQRRFEIRAEDKKRLNKQFGKMTREANAHRKKYKS
jgi:ribosome biogenesis GTPase / thiamine phosphate phosphatase